MSKPVIGMVELGSGLVRKYLRQKYVDCVKRAGGEVRFLTPTQDSDIICGYVKSCGGILMPGGVDINPELYGEEKSDKCGSANAERDAFEPLLIREAIAQNKPMLCICRGIQILNVTFGGTLYQDIGNKEREINHFDVLKKNGRTHEVAVDSGSLLYELTGRDILFVNSMHHQAVKQVGKGLKATAVSTDGFIEGLEIEGYRQCVAVQWHPEHMARRDGLQQKLFDNFVEQARKFAETRVD